MINRLVEHEQMNGKCRPYYYQTYHIIELMFFSLELSSFRSSKLNGLKLSYLFDRYRDAQPIEPINAFAPQANQKVSVHSIIQNIDQLNRALHP